MDAICRLCGAGNAFISLFTPKSRKLDLLRNVIILSSGVQIREDDIVSKMVCQRCCEIAVKLHRYRSKALSNDKLLKAQYGIPQAQSTNRSIENTLHLSNGHDNIDNTSDFSLQSIVADNTRNISDRSIINRQSTIARKDVMPQPKIVSRPKYRHPSVVRLHKQHPSAIIPREVSSDDVSPFITLDKSEVTDWYETQVEKMKEKLPHIRFKKVTNVNSSSNIEKYNNKDSSTNDITSTPVNNLVPNKNITLKSRKDSTINDPVKSVSRATSDTNRNCAKSKVRPTARKSTTMIKANVPKKITPGRKRSLSNSSTSTIGDYAAFFDSALPNSTYHSEESDSDRPKKRPCSRNSLKKKKNVSNSSSSSQTGFISATENAKSVATATTFKAEKRKGSDRKDSSSSSQTGFISDKGAENSKSLATATKLKAVSAEKRKGSDRKDRRDSSSTDLRSDKGTQPSKSLETVGTFKIFSVEKQKQRKDRSSSSSSSLIELVDVKPTEKWKEGDKKGSSSGSKSRLMNDKLEIAKTVERTSMIKSLVAEKLEEIAWPPKSEKRAPKILQKARKKTAKLSATSKDKITENGKISKKKNKRYFNKDMVTDFVGFDTLDSNRPSKSEEPDTNSVVEALPGKSTSDSDSLFVLTSGKTLPVFICAVCSLVCDTKMQLVHHEKSHLTCKFCKIKIKNWQALIEHLNDTCIINVKQDNARVRLVRVDDNPSVVAKYRTAFQNDNISDFESNDDGGFDNHDDFDADVKDECDEEEPTLIKHEDVKLEHTENDGEIICLSDDDPVEFSVVQRHTIVQEEDIQIDDELKIINRTDDDIYLFDAMLKHHSSETEMIKTLFKKYYHGLIKFDKRSQTFRNSNRCVRRTSNNLILLERMLSELTVYIVAVNVECRASITARFNSPQTPAISPLEYWGHKKTTCIVKRAKSKSAAKLKEISAPEVKSLKRPPIQVVSVETKVAVNNMTVEEITPPPQTSNAPIKSAPPTIVPPTTVPPTAQLVDPPPPNSFQEAFITSSNIPTNTVNSVPIALIPAQTVELLPSANYNLIATTSNSLVPQLLPNANYDLIPTTSNALVPYCPLNPSTSGNQNDPIANAFVVVAPNVLQPTGEAVVQEANCISTDQPNDATSSSNPAPVE